MKRIWRVVPTQDTSSLQTQYLSPLMRQLLWNRGIHNAADARTYLHPEYTRDLHNPFLFREMEKAATRILRAIDDKEKVVIHGDYDADGVCASAILSSTIKFLGGEVAVHLPHRMEDGYGVAVQAIKQFIRKKINLLITADCGISSMDALVRAQEAGMDVIITDHHAAPQEIPPCYAIIHCDIPGEAYPFNKLSAGGVAFKLAQALLQTARMKHLNLHIRNAEAFEKWLLDLVAISTVADVMPLVGENRTLVHFGLQVLNKTKRKGLAKLIERARLMRRGSKGDLNARNIAFHIAPRLNAAGRMSHASLAYELLCAQTEEDAVRYAEELEGANRARQKSTEQMMVDAHTQLLQMEDNKSVVVWNHEWSVGLVGLAAGKLADEYGKPSFVIGTMRGQWTGSARGYAGFDCIALLRDVGNVLDHFGGHAQAAGFTLKEGVQPEQFLAELNGTIKARNTPPAESYLSIDMETDFAGMTEEFIHGISTCAPFGEGNPSPLLLTRQCRVQDVVVMGSKAQHVKCTVIDAQGVQKCAIAFGHNNKDAQVLREGVMADIVYEPTIQEWGGERTIELYVRDAHISE